MFTTAVHSRGIYKDIKDEIIENVNYNYDTIIFSSLLGIRISLGSVSLKDV